MLFIFVSLDPLEEVLLVDPEREQVHVACFYILHVLKEFDCKNFSLILHFIQTFLVRKPVVEFKIYSGSELNFLLVCRHTFCKFFSDLLNLGVIGHKDPHFNGQEVVFFLNKVQRLLLLHLVWNRN